MADKPFHYSYHNRAFIGRLLALAHAHASASTKVLPWDLDKALKSAAKRYEKFCGNTSKYVPHQGEKECARRRRQITGERGRNVTAFSLR